MSLPARAVWVDVQGCQNTAHFERGIARQAAEHTKALLEVAPEAIHTVGLTPRRPVPASLDFLLGTGLMGWATGPGTEPDPPPRIYHVTSPFEGPDERITLEDQWPHWARRPATRLVITLHDLIPLLFPEHYVDPHGLRGQRWISRLGMVRTADHILAVSQSSAADAVEQLGVDEDRITVIDAGTSVQMAAAVPSDEEAAKIVASSLPQIREGFLFYVGGGDWRKNVPGLIRAYALLPERLRERHQLVITYKLSDFERGRLEVLTEECGVRGQVVLTGFVPDRELAALYRRCALFVFPSLYEGAGLPILEAMACGAPAIGSSVSSVPEILGETGVTFDPSSPADVAEKLERTLEKPEELERLRGVSAERVAHFTWERVARLSLEGYERALAMPGHRDTRRPARKRLAFFTPWPPEDVGAAAYGRELAQALSARADVDVFVGGTDTSAYDRSLEPGIRVWPARDFDWVANLRAFDRVLYALGDSPLYLHSLLGLMERPGAVIAHDVRLGRLYSALHEAEHGDNPLWMREKLFELYGGRVPSDTLRLAAEDPAAAHHFGVYMSREVQALAERILVHSDYAADALRLDRLPGEAGADASVVPMAVPAAPIPISRDGASPEPLIVSHAASEGPDAIDLLLHGLAELRARHPGARLALLGELRSGAEERLAETARNLGIADAVERLGRLEGDRYWQVLAAADAAVELRTGTDGEASAGVCDLLAARVPLVVSALGWLGELPEPAVLHVPRGCSAAELGARIEDALDTSTRKRIASAQEELARATSPESVTERYAELLGL
jgi:glycosyltransferase involved in cell wall biosynthesis